MNIFTPFICFVLLLFQDGAVAWIDGYACKNFITRKYARSVLSFQLRGSFQDNQSLTAPQIDQNDAIAQDSEASAVTLLSFRYSQENIGFSKSVQRVWKWKDQVLGDGRDFFVPKPRTLTALNQALIRTTPIIKECAVISNCARFELLLVCSPNDANVLRHAVSECIASQVQFYQSKTNILWDQLGRFDWPDMIEACAIERTSIAMVQEIESHWTVLHGVEPVCRHLCVVAAGMAERPSRPGRPVPFRPFSSRDAHILLQLKRTAEVAQGSRVRALLDSALGAGKAARDPQQVPQLRPLQRFGSGNRYAQEAPADLSETAAAAAMNLVIEPTVRQCGEKWTAMSHSTEIAQLRKQAEQLTRSPEELRCVRKYLHQPTMDLRAGVVINREELLEQVQLQLLTMRAKSESTTPTISPML